MKKLLLSAGLLVSAFAMNAAIIPGSEDKPLEMYALGANGTTGVYRFNPSDWANPTKNLSQAELHLLQTLERRRLSNRGRLFALIADPHSRYRRVCALYLAWLQRHAMPLANAAIGVPRLSDPDVPRPSLRRLNRFLGSEPIPPVRHYRHQLQIDFAARCSDLYAIPRAHFFAARNPDSLRGYTFSQLLIDRADTIAPSRPYHRGIFTILPRACYPALPLNAPHVCLILGNPYRTRRNHFRRYWLKLARDNPDCLLCQPEAELAARRVRLLAQRQARSAANPPQTAIPGVTASRRQHRRLLFVPAASRNTGSDGVPPSAASSTFCSILYPKLAAEGGTPSLPKVVA